MKGKGCRRTWDLQHKAMRNNYLTLYSRKMQRLKLCILWILSHLCQWQHFHFCFIILTYLCSRIRIQKLNLSFNIIFTVLVSRQYKPKRNKCFSSWQLLSLGGVFKQSVVSGGQFCTKLKLTLSWLAVVGNSFICCQDHSSGSDQPLIYWYFL